MKRAFFAAAVLAALGLVAIAPASAHHSFAATYFEDQTTKIEGDLVQFQFRNPHSYVHLQAPDEKGEMQRWAVEWAGTSQLANTGVTRESLKIGDQVVITARPSRVSGEYRVLMVRLVRPSDGFTWGSRGGEVVD